MSNKIINISDAKKVELKHYSVGEMADELGKLYDRKDLPEDVRELCRDCSLIIYTLGGMLKK